MVGRTCRDALSAPLTLFLQHGILHMTLYLSLHHLEAQVSASLGLFGVMSGVCEQYRS